MKRLNVSALTGLKTLGIYGIMAALKRSRARVYQLLQEGRIKGVKDARGDWRVTEAEVKRYLRERESR
jgi:excisionase family DNA binding protein